MCIFLELLRNERLKLSVLSLLIIHYKWQMFNGNNSLIKITFQCFCKIVYFFFVCVYLSFFLQLNLNADFSHSLILKSYSFCCVFCCCCCCCSFEETKEIQIFYHCLWVSLFFLLHFEEITVLKIIFH